jgi:biopolymer transport protein ExbD
VRRTGAAGAKRKQFLNGEQLFREVEFMAWQVRHQGSPRIVGKLSLQQVADGLRDGQWETTDEVLGPGEARWRPIETHPQLAEVAQDVDMPPPARHPEATSLDFNALIDVCLVLLIFFILTTSYADLVQKVVEIPSVKADGKVRTVKVADIKTKMIVLQAVLDKSGRPVLRVELQPVDALTTDGKAIDTAKLRSAIQPFVRGEDRKTELLLDAREVSWETVIQIQDAARAAGIKKIHYAKAQ